MADNTDIALNVKVDGVEKSINSIKELKEAIKAAKDEQVKAATTFGEGSQEYIKASKNLGELKDKMDDLNDSTQSLRGSGVESLSSSFGMLGDGLKNLDLDKIKTGFKGIGQAMSAVPLMLLVTGITMLMEKFDVFGKIAEAVIQIMYAFTDAIGLTNKADEEFAKNAIENSKKVQKSKEEQYNSEIRLAQAAGRDVKELEIKKLKSTEDSIKSQIVFLENLRSKKGELNDEELKQYEDLQSNLLKASTDRQAKELENERVKQQQLINLSNLEDKLRIAGLSDREKEIDAIKKQQQALTDELNKNHQVRLGNEMADTIRYNEDIKKINDITQQEINKINAKYYQEDLDKQNEKLKIQKDKQDERFNEYIKSQEDELNSLKNRLAEEQRLLSEQRQYELDVDESKRQAINNKNLADAELKVLQNKNDIDAQIALLETKRQIELQNLELTSQERALINEKYAQQEIDLAKQKAEEEKQIEHDKAVATLDIAKASNDSMQSLSDLYFTVKRANLKKGSKEDLEQAKKQFNINKALAITSATISGIQGVVNALSAQSAIPEPYGTILKVANAVGVGIATAANVAKIASSKFDESGNSTGGGGGAVTSVPTPAPPTINTPSANTNQSTTFDQTGKNLNQQPTNPTINVNATVGVDEVSDKQKRVTALETQSTF